MCACKGICPRYKARKKHGIGRYEDGQRRCQVCEMFINYDGLFCPCCGYRLRCKPRSTKYKIKYNKALSEKRVNKYGILSSMKDQK